MAFVGPILFLAGFTVVLSIGVPAVAVVVGFFAVAFTLFGVLLALFWTIAQLVRGPGRLRYWWLQRRAHARRVAG